MAQVKNTLWNRYKYKINAVVLLITCYFLYQSFYPEFPPVWDKRQVGDFEVAAMPYNVDAPYLHDGVYTKDFFLIFSKGQVSEIKQAYLTIGLQPLPLSELMAEDHGILHGSQHGQEVHALAPKMLAADHKVWLTIQTWQGEVLVTSWPLPNILLTNG